MANMVKLGAYLIFGCATIFVTQGAFAEKDLRSEMALIKRGCDAGSWYGCYSAGLAAALESKSEAAITYCMCSTLSDHYVGCMRASLKGSENPVLSAIDAKCFDQISGINNYFTAARSSCFSTELENIVGQISCSR